MVSSRRESLKLQRADLTSAIQTLQRRIKARAKDACAHPKVSLDPKPGLGMPTTRTPCSDCRNGYDTQAIRYAKQRRLQVLQARLVDVQGRLRDGDWRLMPGGGRRMRNRHHLDQAGRDAKRKKPTGLTQARWRDDWLTARAWCGASGSTGEDLGNRVFKLDPDTGRLSITVPLPVAAQFGLAIGHARAAGGVLTLAAPVTFPFNGGELTARLAAKLGVRFDLDPVYEQGTITKIYLRASWTREDLPLMPTLETARDSGLLGVDLNNGHFDVARIDAFGNPIGAPTTVPFQIQGPASLRDARLREAITALLDHARACGAHAIGGGRPQLR